MKRMSKLLIVSLGILALFSQLYVAHSTSVAAQDKAVAFIRNALPIESSQYNITLKNYNVIELPALNNKNIGLNGDEVLTYSLESEKGSLRTICTLRNNVVFKYIVNDLDAQSFGDQGGTTVDSVIGFLSRYQSSSGLASTEIIDMLSNVDLSKNASIASGNIKMTIKRADASEMVFSNVIGIRWVRTINGCDYLMLDLTFRNGLLIGMLDQRAIYSIGDTSVNISKEQAIIVAMNYIKDYSYTVPRGVEISGFNVTEERTVAQLVPVLRTSDTLYPSWNVMLYLNQTYPGSVYGFSVNLWADSGEVWGCYNQAGAGTVDSTTPIPESINSSANPNSLQWEIGIAIAITVFMIVTALIIKRKRR